MFGDTNVALDRALTSCGAASPVSDYDDSGNGSGARREEASCLCDGGDLRYMGIANKRVFSTPRLGAAITNPTLRYACSMLSSSTNSRSTLAAPTTRFAAAASSRATMAAVSQQLTPVRHPFLGRPSQPQTPYHHSTLDDHEQYQRFLANAVLSESEAGRSSSVLSFPMRTPTRLGSVRCQATPDPSITPGVLRCGADITDNDVLTRTSALGISEEIASDLTCSRLSSGWGAELIDEGTRFVLAQTTKLQQGEGGVGVKCLWSPGAKAHRNAEGYKDIAGSESTSDDAADTSRTPAPFIYFHRAPPVQPSSTRHQRISGRDTEEMCGAVVLGLAPTEGGEAEGALHAAQQTQYTREGFGAATASGFPHTPRLTYSDSTVDANVTVASSSTPRNSPSALLPEGHAGCLDGVQTPLYLRSQMGQEAIVCTPPAPAPLTPTLASRISSRRENHRAGSEEAPAVCFSPPTDCVTETSYATPLLFSLTDNFIPAGPPLSAWVRARTTTRTSFLPPDEARHPHGDQSSFSSVRRQLATPQSRLFTPVQNTDNSIRSASIAGSPATASSDFLTLSWSSSRPTAASLDATSSTKFAATHHRGLSHHRDDGSSVPHSHAHGQMQPHRCLKRFSFQFVRALTAGEVSTDVRHHPVQWGAFGILVAQPEEVWCVGRARPFRLFPPQGERPQWLPSPGELQVSAVTTTEQLSLAQWEAATMESKSSEESPPVVVYAAVGSSAGDVFVFGYCKCPTTAPGAIPVIVDTEEGLVQCACTVRLERQGILRRADRVRASDGVSKVDTSVFPVYESLTSEGSIVSVVRLVDHWLYVGDQSGHVARYNLQDASFLSGESCAVKWATPNSFSWKREEISLLGTCRDPVVKHFLQRVSSRIPRHRSKISCLLTEAAAKETASKQPECAPVGSTPTQHFHYAVNVEEPVYHIEVTRNQGYLAVGTQTRLLVYRTAQLSRVWETPSLPPRSPSLPFQASPTVTSMDSSACASDIGGSYALRGHADSATPLVVVSDLVQPMRCFSWMLCDYESLMQSPDARSLEERRTAFSHGDDDDDFGASFLVAPVSGDGVGIGEASHKFSSRCNAYSRHTPMPSLVYATQWQQPINAAEGPCPQQLAPQMITDIRVFRLATQKNVTCCSLDYPVRSLQVLPGSTRIIVGTGAAVELSGEVCADAPSLDAQIIRTPATSPVDALTGLSLSRSGTLSSFRTTATTTTTTTTAAAASAFRSPAIMGHRPSLAVVAAERLWHQSPTIRPTVRNVDPMDAGVAQVQRRQQQGEPTDDKSGYVFLLEVCPADDPAVVGDEGVDCRVFLRVRGEVKVGDGESVVCGTLGTGLNHIAMLTRPTEDRVRTAASVPEDGSRERVKVWRITTDGQSDSIVPSERRLSLHSESQRMESLR